MRVAAVPVGPAGADPSPLWEEIEAGLVAAARDGAVLAVLPELTALPYAAGDDPARWSHLAEPMDGPTCGRMRQLSARLEISVVFGMALWQGEGLPLNAAMLARLGGDVLPIAGKMRLPPRLAGDRFGEADHFRSAASHVGPVRIGSLRVAALVCFDRRFPDHWREAAEAGADLVAVLVAAPAPDDPPGFFADELRGHARRHGLDAVSAARYGTETMLGRPVRHDGDTLIVGRDGAVLARADPIHPRPIVAAIGAPVGAALRRPDLSSATTT